MWTQIINQLIENQRFVISSHLNPDCDALGSELGLAHHLINIGKDVSILNSDATPSTYYFLDPYNLIHCFSEKKHAHLVAQADVIIVVDASGGWQRLGRVGDTLSTVNAVSICIDHHPNGEPFTDLSHVDPSAAATGELIFKLIKAMDGEITQSIAEALYTAIVTDTGNFRFSSTSSRTHTIAAQLLAAGANPTRIYTLLYEQHPLSNVHLKGHVLSNIQLTGNGKIAYVGLSLETLKKYNVASSDLDGFSSLAQQIKGVTVAIFLVELPRNRVKISLRSDGTVPVNEVAARFGGGGHIPAAGAITQGTVGAVMAQVIAEVALELKASTGNGVTPASTGLASTGPLHGR